MKDENLKRVFDDINACWKMVKGLPEVPTDTEGAVRAFAEIVKKIREVSGEHNDPFMGDLLLAAYAEIVRDYKERKEATA